VTKKQLLQIPWRWGFLLLLLVSLACQPSTGAPTPSPAPTHTAVPATATPVPLPTVTATLPSPAGPQAGAQMLYFDGSTLVYIPAGTYTMGGSGKSNPTHAVQLSSYWIQRTEVTRRMYGICMAAGSCGEAGQDPFLGNMDDTALIDMPITEVTWDQANAYCTWLGGRLPTEAEWEIAARGTTNTSYPWGNTKPVCGLLNSNRCTDGLSYVTAFTADISPFGVLDMGGNASEWVNDYFQADYFKTAAVQDPQGPEDGDYRIVRGGSYNSSADNAAVDFRALMKPATSRADLGFRCAVTTPKQYVPYCQAAPNIDPASNAAARPASRCTPNVQNDPGAGDWLHANRLVGSVSGGRLVSMEGTMDCTLNGNYYRCTPQSYPPSPSAQQEILRVCITCPVAVPPTASDLSCPLNYQKQAEGTYCTYSGAPAANNCPAGAIALNQNQCMYQTQQTGGCPLGSYFDKALKACATLGQISASCLPGATYLPGTGCCTAPLSASYYPQCQTDEYYNYALGCVPLPQVNTVTVEGCLTIHTAVAIQVGTK